MPESAQDSAIIPIPVKSDEKSFTVDLGALTQYIRSMPIPAFTRFCADVLPGIEKLRKTAKDVAIERMKASGQRELPVLTDDGELTGRVVITEAKRDYDVDVDRLRHAEEIFHKEGHTDVKLVWTEQVEKHPTVAQVQALCKKRGGEGAKEAEQAFSERYCRWSLKVEAKGKSATADKKIKKAKEEVKDIGNPWK
jgi:hypothetical protein